MKILIIAVGTKMPKWVQEGFREYQKRMPSNIQLLIKEIEPDKRSGKGGDEKSKEKEAKEIMAAIPKKAYIVALDERGNQYTSLELSKRFASWQNVGSDIVLLVGGPNGLTDELRNMANELWSLSKLTLPHPLVRIFLAETIYRAWSIDMNLPYHRA